MSVPLPLPSGGRTATPKTSTTGTTVSLPGSGVTRFQARATFGPKLWSVTEATPGCLPEADPATFATRSEATRYALTLVAELRRDGYRVSGSAKLGLEGSRPGAHSRPRAHRGSARPGEPAVTGCEPCGRSLEAHEVRIYSVRGGDPIQWSGRIFDGKARRIEVRCQHPATLLRHGRAAWQRFAADLASLDLADPERITRAAEHWCSEHGAIPTEVELFARVVRHGGERIGNVRFNGYYRSIPTDRLPAELH